MTDNAEKLYQLAKSQFTSLSPVEDLAFKKLCHGITQGRVVNFSSKDENDNDPVQSKSWTAGRLLKSEWFIWLCTNPQAIALVPQKGFHVRGARIVGELELGFTKISIPIQFNRCSLEQIILCESEVRQLCLSGSHIQTLFASGIKTSSLFLNNGFKCEGEVILVGAFVNGDLDCTSGHFRNPDKRAFTADGITVSGNAYLRNGFRTEGELRFPGADIGKDLDCRNSQFNNHQKEALFADGIKIGKSIFLRNSKVDGEIRIPGARIGGDLDCLDCEFNNPGKVALSAFGVRTDANVFLGGIKACLCAMDLKLRAI